MIGGARYVNEYQVTWIMESILRTRADGEIVLNRGKTCISETTQDLATAKAAEKLLLDHPRVGLAMIQVRTVRQERRWSVGGPTWEVTGMTRWFDGEDAPFETMLQEGM